VSSLNVLFKYLLLTELRFDTMLYSNLVAKILMRAISNVHASRIWPAGRRFPTPNLNESKCLWKIFVPTSFRFNTASQF